MAPLITFLLAAGLIIFVALGTFLGTHSDNVAQLGPAGDFFGGFANPLFAFLAFIGVLIGAFLQQRALTTSKDQAAEATDALAKQLKASEHEQFEATFFQMLSLHNEIVNGIEHVHRQNVVYSGRRAFPRFRDMLFQQYNDDVAAFHAAGGLPPTKELLERVYTEFWGRARSDLGHYMRFFYNIIRFVDQSSVEDKYKYVRIARATLSDYELIVIFYNCFFPPGERLRRYAEKYALFNNLADDMYFNVQHRALLDDSAYEYTP